MSDYFDAAFVGHEPSPGPFLGGDDEGMFDFTAASDSGLHSSYQGTPTRHENAQRRLGSAGDAGAPDSLSDDEDGLNDGISDSNRDAEDEAGDEEGAVKDNGASWKIDHTSGDHKLKGKLSRWLRNGQPAAWWN
jgi:hypothetical protein